MKLLKCKKEAKGDLNNDTIFDMYEYMYMVNVDSSFVGYVF